MGKPGGSGLGFAVASGKEGFLNYAGKTLQRLDTGIIGLEGERVDVDVLPQDAGLRKSIAGLKEDELITVVMEKAAGDYGFEILTAHAGEDRPVIERMRTLHMGSDGKNIVLV